MFPLEFCLKSIEFVICALTEGFIRLGVVHERPNYAKKLGRFAIMTFLTNQTHFLSVLYFLFGGDDFAPLIFALNIFVTTNYFLLVHNGPIFTKSKQANRRAGYTTFSQVTLSFISTFTANRRDSFS